MKKIIKMSVPQPREINRKYDGYSISELSSYFMDEYYKEQLPSTLPGWITYHSSMERLNNLTVIIEAMFMRLCGSNWLYDEVLTTLSKPVNITTDHQLVFVEVATASVSVSKLEVFEYPVTVFNIKNTNLNSDRKELYLIASYDEHKIIEVYLHEITK